jgi:hypothetical protein
MNRLEELLGRKLYTVWVVIVAIGVFAWAVGQIADAIKHQFF